MCGWCALHAGLGCALVLGRTLGTRRLQRHRVHERHKKSKMQPCTKKNLHRMTVQGTGTLRWKIILDRGHRLGVVVQHGCEMVRRDEVLSHGASEERTE